MQDPVTLDLLQHNEKLRNTIDVSLQETFLLMICCSKHSRTVLEAVQLKQRLSEVALFISCLFYLNTGSRDWYMMPGRIGSKGNSAVTETPNITWKKLHSPCLCLSNPPSPYSVIHPLILISLALSRFKTHLQMQRKLSIFKCLKRSTSLDDMRLRLWKAHLYSWQCKTLSWMLLPHWGFFNRKLGFLPFTNFFRQQICNSYCHFFISYSRQSWKIKIW